MFLSTNYLTLNFPFKRCHLTSQLPVQQVPKFLVPALKNCTKTVTEAQEHTQTKKNTHTHTLITSSAETSETWQEGGEVLPMAVA